MFSHRSSKTPACSRGSCERSATSGRFLKDNGDAVSVGRRNAMIKSRKGESVTGVKYLCLLDRNEQAAGFKGIYRDADDP